MSWGLDLRDSISYQNHDHPSLQLFRAIVDKGPSVIDELLPRLMTQYPEALTFPRYQRLAHWLADGDVPMPEEA